MSESSTQESSTLANQGAVADQQLASGVPSQAAPDDGMTMMEHLVELRQRVVASAIAVVLGLVATTVPLPPTWDKNITWLVVEALVKLVDGKVQQISPGEVFFAYFQVALWIALALAMPVVMYQIILFVLPALLPEEKKLLYIGIPGAMASFVIGVLFGYFVVAPAALRFLTGFAPTEIIESRITISNLLDFVASLLFWLGVAFQLPLVIFFLVKLGVVNVQRLQGFRRYALVGAFVIGALITPTPDPVNQTLVSLPIYLLFELGILLARLA